MTKLKYTGKEPKILRLNGKRYTFMPGQTYELSADTASLLGKEFEPEKETTTKEPAKKSAKDKEVKDNG